MLPVLILIVSSYCAVRLIDSCLLHFHNPERPTAPNFWAFVLIAAAIGIALLGFYGAFFIPGQATSGRPF